MTTNTTKFTHPPGDVLIVDDAVPNLELLSGLLKEVGHRVRPVSSGPMALQAVEHRPPEVILLDINMPEMSGFEVCRRLKANPATAAIPVLFISALSETRDKLRAFETGCVDFISKPFRLEEVRARVDTHLKLYRLHAKLDQQNRELGEAHDHLLALQRLRDNLTDMIVHDLRSPLTGIVSSLKFMEEDAGERGGVVEMMDIRQALRSSKRLMSMVNELLDINRMESEQMPLHIGRGKTATMMTNVRELLGPERAERLNYEAAAIPESVECDSDLVERVLVNLLDNAFKASPIHETVEVVWRETDEGWELLVCDRGPGIPDKYKTRIFEKFGQIQARVEQEVPSTGLGLTFCRLVAQAHGGDLVVSDRSGGGSEFRLSARPGEIQPVSEDLSIAGE